MDSIFSVKMFPDHHNREADSIILQILQDCASNAEDGEENKDDQPDPLVIEPGMVKMVRI